MKKIETSIGAYVIASNKILIVFQKATNTWAFPKGHVESGESVETTLTREIYEETGITEFEILDFIGEYTRGSRKSNSVIKRIMMFIIRTNTTSVKPTLDDIQDCKWVQLHEIPRYLSYKEDIDFFNINKSKLEICLAG